MLYPWRVNLGVPSSRQEYVKLDVASAWARRLHYARTLKRKRAVPMMLRRVGVVGLLVGLAALGLFIGGRAAPGQLVTASEDLPRPPKTAPAGSDARPPADAVTTHELLSRSELRDTVVRGTATAWTLTPGGGDPNNGVELFSEKWLRFDDQGVLVEYRAVLRRADGTVTQRVRFTRESHEVFLADSLIRGPDGEPVHTLKVYEGASAVVLDRLYPAAVDTKALAAAGFAPLVEPPSIAVPPLKDATSISAEPIMVFRNSGSARAFERVLQSGGTTRTSTLVFDAVTGRSLVYKSVTLDENGALIMQSIGVNGPLEVFRAADVPWPPPATRMLGEGSAD